MKQLHLPKFFSDRIQLVFALVLVSIVFTIAYLTFVQLGTQSSTNTTSSHSKTRTQQQPTAIVKQGYIYIQANKAIALVESIKEVQSAESAAASNNTQFVTEIDSYPTSQNYFYLVHAYEIVPDGNGNGHTATVGWYRVDPQTGKVTNDTNP